MTIPDGLLQVGGFLALLGGLWWRLEQIKKRATDIAAWRQDVNNRLSAVEKELVRGSKRFDEHAATDAKILEALQDIKIRLTRIETTLEKQGEL